MRIAEVSFFTTTSKKQNIMEKALNIIRWCMNIILGTGCLLVFNENPDNFTPNLIGLACFFLLIVINNDRKWKN